MKIFLAGTFEEEHLTAWSVKRALEELGHDVLIFDYRQRFYKNPDKFAFVNFLLLIDKFNPGLILIIKGEWFSNRILTAISGYKIALWHFDFTETAKKQMATQAKDIDYIFTMCKPWHEVLLGKRGGFWLPQGHDPVMFPPVPANTEEQDDVAFIGSLKPKREDFVNSFVQAGFKVAIYGEGWHDSKLKDLWRGPAYCKDFSQAVANTKIVVSITAGSGEILELTISQRIFRVCGCKGVFLTEYVPGLEYLYEIGEEIFTYGDVSEAIEIASSLLENHSKRENASLRCYKRTMEEHLYVHRLRRLMECVS